MKRLRFSAMLLAFVMALISAVTLCPQTANATVTITPTIVVIEGHDRYADVTLLNTDEATKSYDIRWRFFRQEENTGTYKESAQSITDFDLSKHIVFTPRRVTLAPHGLQKIRLGLRLNGDQPAPGDYRGHLEVMENSTPADETSEIGKPKVSVHVNVGFSIPVIYRVGDVHAAATIGTISTTTNPKTGKIEATIPITRGNTPYGTLGHILVYYKAANGKETQVGELKNANIFSEISRRVFSVPLETASLSGGVLHVVYKDQDNDKKLVFAETDVPIGH